MGTSVSHNHQKNYRPEGEQVERRNVRGEDNKYVNTEQSGVKQQARGQERKEENRPVAHSQALPPRPIKQTSIVEPQYSTRVIEARGSANYDQKDRNIKPTGSRELRPSNSNLRPGSIASSIRSTQRVIQLSESKVYFHTENEINSNMQISAIRVKGFDNEEFEDKKLRKFNISIDVEEKELIKESNYFDESQGDIGIYSLAPIKYGDFNIGHVGDLGTFHVKTYRYDVALKDKLVA